MELLLRTRAPKCGCFLIIGRRWIPVLADIANAVTAAGVIFVVLQLRDAQLQRHRSFEDLFIQRYWHLLDNFSLAFHEARGQAPVGSTSGMTDKDLAGVRAYLGLSEDQVDMRRIGWVTDDTWAVWRDGILTALDKQPVRAVWEHVKESQPDEFACLRDLEDNGPLWDPIALSRLDRWRRGL